MEITREVIAQLITTLIAFLGFFFVAKKLFWGGILGAIEDRQTKIRGEFDRIDAMQKQVTALQADYQKRIADIDTEARQRIQEEISKGRVIAEQIAEQSRKDAAAQQEAMSQKLSIEMDKARQTLKDEVVRMTMGATEKIIRERLDDQKHRQLVSSFVEELSHK
jgi:F-type H+-transporting ATPase subunit b